MNEAWCKDERTALVYQVVESLANDFGITDDPAIRNFLDLLVYGKSENPVLPFPKFTHLQDTINQHRSKNEARTKNCSSNAS
jgi:hypothetical protein